MAQGLVLYFLSVLVIWYETLIKNASGGMSLTLIHCNSKRNLLIVVNDRATLGNTKMEEKKIFTFSRRSFV
jgi:hypothetical protein